MRFCSADSRSIVPAAPDDAADVADAPRLPKPPEGLRPDNRGGESQLFSHSLRPPSIAGQPARAFAARKTRPEARVRRSEKWGEW